MRKFISTITVFIILLATFTACKASANASEKAVSAAKQAIECVDDYLDGKVGYDDISDKLDEIGNSMEYASEYTPEEKNEDPQKYSDYRIHFELLLLPHSILMDSIESDPESYQEIIDCRNKIASYAGLPER